MTSIDELGVRYLTEAQILELGRLPALALSETGTRRLTALVRRVGDVLQATTALAERSERLWRIVAAHVVNRPHPLGLEDGGNVADFADGSELWKAVEEASTTGDLRSSTSRRDGKWTVLPIRLSGTRRAVLLFAGDWRLAGQALSGFGEQLSGAFRAPIPSAGGLRRASHRLARRLSKTNGLGPVCSAIVDAMATSVRARLGAIAVVDPSDRRLSIKATHGYPLMLVEHMRIEPGEGVFGFAFDTAKVLRVPGSGATGAPRPTRRRPRYRTDSFVAMPILAGDEVLAVVCVADRVDDKAFTRTDVSALRALAAPAVLALARERAVARAEAYAHAAAVDPVSGLFNRRYFHVRLEEELQRSRRHEIPLALLMMDIDDFKAVNDLYGHLVGDSVIKEAAEIIRRAVRVFDVCTRFGGEEFAVIMPASSEESAGAVAERIRARVAAFRAAERPLSNLRVSVSIGLALSEPGLTAHELISRADEALYAAKRAGKDRVRAYRSDAPI